MTDDRMRAGEALDGVALEELASSFGGDEEAWEFVRELIETFLDDGPAQLATLRGALERGHAEEARRAAHTLKSNGATFGAQSFSDLCRELEAKSREGAFDGTAELLPQAEEEWKRVREALKAVRGRGSE